MLVSLASLAVALAWWRLWAQQPVSAPVRLTADIGADVSLVDTFGASSILSPDGTMLAFTGAGSLNQVGVSLYVRRLEQLKATQLAGTEGALNPFFSPDGKSIGFFAGGKLKKIAVAGGPAITLCDAPIGRGGSWGDDGWIVFAPTSAPGTPLQRVSSDGGSPEKLFAIVEGEATQRWPQVLPGGKAVIFTSPKVIGDFATSSIVVQTLPNGPRKVLTTQGYYARYIASGHLLFFRERTLFAAPFDVDRLEMTGPAVPAVEDARSSTSSGGAQFDVSTTGTLVYAAGDTLVRHGTDEVARSDGHVVGAAQRAVQLDQSCLLT